MHLYPPEVEHGEVLPAVSDDQEALHVRQAGVHGGEPRQHHVSGGAHPWAALPHVHEGMLTEECRSNISFLNLAYRTRLGLLSL